ncbi:phosphoglycerate mutase-like protein 1 [Hibiscus syriacus]|uniref:phosphoglycerate mutase-like protein 1 n=1 Tax=Hibiscus syriacus TaxID=106335 RepID=UPI001923CA99|nr:phosphoglycerate mutase-like protein 1 [Hibiscus syriacus]
METASPTSSPYLLSNQKLLHLVRHAQGLHNLGAETNRDSLTQFIDAALSPLGWQQVRAQRENVSASGMLQGIEVVITSPLLRTLQTSVGVFGSEEQQEDHCGNKTSTLNHPPIIAAELCRERMRKGRSRATVGQCRSRFPQVDFSLIESEEDTLWEADERETNEAVAARGIKFIKWVLGRKEREIAVVSHGVFLQETLIALKNKCLPLMDTDPFTRFGNCEIRSVIIFNRSVEGLGSDSRKTNYYCGRIPNGLQLQDSAKDNVSVDQVIN